MTRPRRRDFDRSRGPSLLLGLAVMLAPCVLTGCVRYNSNRDHLERKALVLSPTDESTRPGSTSPSIGVRN